MPVFVKIAACAEVDQELPVLSGSGHPCLRGNAKFPGFILFAGVRVMRIYPYCLMSLKITVLQVKVKIYAEIFLWLD